MSLEQIKAFSIQPRFVSTGKNISISSVGKDELQIFSQLSFSFHSMIFKTLTPDEEGNKSHWPHARISAHRMKKRSIGSWSIIPSNT